MRRIKKTLRCAALQYANGQVKECDGLNETLHSFHLKSKQS